MPAKSRSATPDPAEAASKAHSLLMDYFALRSQLTPAELRIATRDAKSALCTIGAYLKNRLPRGSQQRYLAEKLDAFAPDVAEAVLLDTAKRVASARPDMVNGITVALGRLIDGGAR